MSANIDLDVFTSDWRVEEQGYQDPAIRHLAEAIHHTEAAVQQLEAEEGLLDGAELPEDADSAGTYRAALQSTLTLHAAVQHRLKTIALDMGEDPEEVLHVHE
jgi:hypothetical protein